MQTALFFLVTLPAICALKTQPSAQSLDTLPIISLSLAPPIKPYPEVASEIGLLDAKRDIVEKDLYDLLDKAYNASLARARGDLLHVVQRHMQAFKGASFSSHVAQQHRPHHAAAFLEGKESATDFEIKVNVVDVAQSSKDTVSAIELVDKTWTAGERKMFQQACREFDWLTDIVKKELKADLVEASNKFLRSSSRLTSSGMNLRASSHASAWESALTTSSARSSLKSGVANVRLAPSDTKWPRISELIQDMLLRADKHHEQAQAKILDLQLRLLQAENAIIKEGLHSAVQALAASAEFAL